MKRKIVIALSILCAGFFFGGIYIIYTMEIATSKLDHVIVLHQVEILREQFLINLKRLKNDLHSKNTPDLIDIDTTVANVMSVENSLEECFQCHRNSQVLKYVRAGTNENILKKIKYLANGIEEYQESLSRFLTMRANRERIEREYDRALQAAEGLVKEVSEMIHVTTARLSEKTLSSTKDISSIKKLLYLVVGTAPFLAAILGFFFIKQLTKPINTLLDATRRLKRGELEYKIEGLTDEFGELAGSFNEMSDSLQEHVRKIKESENRYRTLFESAADAIFVLEAEGEEPGRIVDANPAAAEMHGYTLDELLNLNLIKDLDTPDAAAAAPERIQRILNGEWVQAEITQVKKDGTVFPVEISAGLLDYMGRKYILAVDRDISDRKKMEDAILQAYHHWEDTFNTITDMITIHDMDYNIVRANKAAQKTLGLTPLQVGKGVKCYEYIHGKDGPPEDCLSCKCFATKMPTSFEIFEPHLGKYLEIRAMPRFDQDNQVVGLIHVIRDITERKRVEEALLRAEQMKLVGEWATGLVHEIKNPLAGIKGSVEVLAGEATIADEDRAIILQAVDEIKRIELLLKSLLSFAKPPKPELTLTDINDILDKSISFALRHPSLLANTASAINVFKDFDSKLPKTMADPMQMQQVFLNLLLNAIEAMPDGGMLATKTSYDERLDSIQVTISDTGQGMDRGIMSKIFQPFFTTKRKGTGLGLAITRRLIEQHGGHIHLESDPGRGTVFNIFLYVNEKKKVQVS